MLVGELPSPFSKKPVEVASRAVAAEALTSRIYKRQNIRIRGSKTAGTVGPRPFTWMVLDLGKNLVQAHG